MTKEEKAVPQASKTNIYKDGLTEEMVSKWKEKYGKVFATPYPDIVFVWRAIDRKDYKEHIAKKENWLDREEEVASTCVLWPGNFDFATEKAGYAALLAENILDESGFISSGPVMEL